MEVYLTRCLILLLPLSLRLAANHWHPNTQCCFWDLNIWVTILHYTERFDFTFFKKKNQKHWLNTGVTEKYIFEFSLSWCSSPQPFYRLNLSGLFCSATHPSHPAYLGAGVPIAGGWKAARGGRASLHSAIELMVPLSPPTLLIRPALNNRKGNREATVSSSRVLFTELPPRVSLRVHGEDINSRCHYLIKWFALPFHSSRGSVQYLREWTPLWAPLSDYCVMCKETPMEQGALLWEKLFIY